jgi:hypothetical protein
MEEITLAQAFRILDNASSAGRSEYGIVAVLEERGVAPELAKVIVDRWRERKSKASSDVAIGAVIAVVGLVITIATLSAGSHGVIAWGAIVFGGIRFFRGLSGGGELPAELAAVTIPLIPKEERASKAAHAVSEAPVSAPAAPTPEPAGYRAAPPSVPAKVAPTPPMSPWAIVGIAGAIGGIGLLCAKASTGPASEPATKRATAEEIAKLEALVKETDEKLVALYADRNAALSKALTELGPRADLGPCPIDVPLPESKDLSVRWAETSKTGHSYDQMMLVDAGDLEHAGAPQTIKLLGPEHTLEMVRLGITSYEDAEKEIKRKAERELPAWEMIVVSALRKDPTMSADSKFEGGYVIGTAFVYDNREKKVVCAAKVVAENSKNLKPTGIKNDAGLDMILTEDLETEAYRAAVKGLALAGPRLPATSDE